MRRIAILLGSGLLLALLTGCPPTYPKCDNDNQCKDHNEVCVQGQCVECATDAQCKTGFVCQANKCVPKPPECQPGSTTCGPGKFCDGGVCAPAQCDPNGPDTCPQGTKCTNYKCVPLQPGTCKNQGDCGKTEECVNGVCTTKVVTPAACNWGPIYFGFNEFTLTPDARDQLSKLPDCFKSETKVTLGGHADERGTEEYNLLLSNKRAAAVKKYLTDLGVPATKMDTVGYGENRPANPGHDEAAWQQNRRVEFNRSSK